MSDTKVCLGCGVAKALDMFSAKSAAKDGRQTKCKSCCAAYQRANKDQVAKYVSAYYQANKDKVAKRMAAYNQANKAKIAAQKVAYYQANKDKVVAYQAAYRQANKAQSQIFTPDDAAFT